MSPVKIYVNYPLDAPAHSALERLAASHELWVAPFGSNSAEDHRRFLEAEVAFGELPADLLPQARRLRWFQLPSVGLDYYGALDWGKLRDQIICTNLRGVFTDAVLQTALAGILAHYRGIDRLVDLKRLRQWEKLQLRPTLRVLCREHVLLVGAGPIAIHFREALSTFGCTFTVYARTTGDIHTLGELDSALARADIVCCALPDTPGTRGVFDAARIARCKRGALFVNVGRGSLLDETALIAALRSGHLGGAVLDVTLREPLPPDDPLWECPNTILTQHTAAGSSRELVDAVNFFGRNLVRYCAGQPLVNVVDWGRGY